MVPRGRPCTGAATTLSLRGSPAGTPLGRYACVMPAATLQMSKEEMAEEEEGEEGGGMGGRKGRKATRETEGRTLGSAKQRGGGLGRGR